MLKYLKTTKDCSLTFGVNKTLPDLHGYTDADWGGDAHTSKSTNGYVFMYNGGAISWRSKLQTTVAQSTMEAEFIGMSTAK